MTSRWSAWIRALDLRRVYGAIHLAGIGVSEIEFDADPETALERVAGGAWSNAHRLSATQLRRLADQSQPNAGACAFGLRGHAQQAEWLKALT